MKRKTILRLIKDRQKWLAENHIQDWNHTDTAFIANEYAAQSLPDEQEVERFMDRYDSLGLSLSAQDVMMERKQGAKEMLKFIHEINKGK